MTPPIQPSSFGGYGRRTGSYGGIDGFEFAARCPPDVQRNTRIVAVCGIPGKSAAPDNDGWFFSDFFLFWQLFGSRVELPNQLWLTCCSPKDLIRKHTQYVHGRASGVEGDRRVVMNEKMLPENEFAAGFRVFKPEDLLERFLATLKAEIQEAAQRKQPVLVLIFGHGEEDTSKIFFGCDGDDKTQWKLTNESLTSVLRKEVQTTMVLTSCYSGGWVMMPNSNKHFYDKPSFNHSILTAAGPSEMCLSWAVSETAGRQAGDSIFATCLLNSILTATETTGEADNNGQLVKVKEEGEDFDFTMAALTKQIMTECQAMDSMWDSHNFSFAVQDDLWSASWGERTGIPLLDYKKMWENLPTAPLLKTVYPPGSRRAGGIRSKSVKALHNIVKVKASRYMRSNPGPNNGGPNVMLHSRFRKLIEGQEFDFEQLDVVNQVLDHRWAQIGLAELYCYTLEIGIPENRQTRDFKEREWQHEQKGVRLERFMEIRRWGMELGIFDRPLPQQGFGYTKPLAYLAARLTESSLSLKDIRKKLENLQQIKLQDAKCVARSALGVAILNKAEIKSTRGRLYNTVGKLKSRLRSLSPQKKTT